MYHLRERRQFRVIGAFLLVIGIFVLLAPVAFAAQPPSGALPAAGQETFRDAAAIPGQAGLVLTTLDPRIIVAKILRVAFTFIGIVLTVIIIYAGFLWMTSAGNEEKIDKARKMIINAVIGLAIILSALGIVQFVINSLLRALAEPPLPAPPAAPLRVGGGALGSGIVESHFPFRDATEVARNTRIIVTFKEAIDVSSIATTAARDAQNRPKFFDEFDDDSDGTIDRRVPVANLTLRTDEIQIIKTADIQDSVRESDVKDYLGSTAQDAEAVDVLVQFTSDLRTFVFTPVRRDNHAQRAFLGSATERMPYRVYLCGTASSRGNCAVDGIRLLTGRPAFSGRFNEYEWAFETGMFFDVTPPKIANVIPIPDDAKDVSSGNCPGSTHGAPCGARDKPRNIMLQINFDEAVLPISAGGKTTIAGSGTPSSGVTLNAASFRVMLVYTQGSAGTRSYYAGTWQLGNQYRTTEFTPTEMCGRNSCGQDVFCLPGLSNIDADVLAASLAAPGDPTSAGLFDGIEDVAGNSMDGNENHVAQGPTAFFNRNSDKPGAQDAPGDNARWSFWTSDDILLGAPTIETTTPVTTRGTATAGVPLALNPMALLFDRAMSATSISSKTGSIDLSGTDTVTGGVWLTWWSVASNNVDEDTAHPLGSTQVLVAHGGLWEKTDYISAAGSGVRDIYQNCYYPSAGQGIQDGAQTVSCTPDADKSYCCNGVSCAAGDTDCNKCGF